MFRSNMMKYYCSQSAYCIVLLSMFIIVNCDFQLGLDNEPVYLAYSTKRRDSRTCIKIASMFEQPSCTNFCHLFTSLTNFTEKLMFQSCGFFLSCKNCTFNEDAVQIRRCPDEFIFINGLCLLKCHSNFIFDDRTKQFTTTFMTWAAMICFIVTSLTISFVVLSETIGDDERRLKYPDRAIFYICICYWFYSIGILIRCFTPSADVGCVEISNVEKVFAFGHLRDWNCAVVFTVLYYFDNAKMFWWIVLCLSWYLEAVKKWGADAKKWRRWWSKLFHAVAWTLPAIMVTAAWWTSSVEAQELTKLCYVGQRNWTVSFGFVIGPTSFLLLIGVIFWIRSVYGMKKVQLRLQFLPNRDLDYWKVRKNCIHVTSFALTFCIPIALVVACDVYQTFVVNVWTRNRSQCKNYDHPNAYERNRTCIRDRAHEPIVGYFVVRIFFSLITGIATTFWIVKKKLFTSFWKKFLTVFRSITTHFVSLSRYKRAKSDQTATSQI